MRVIVCPAGEYEYMLMPPRLTISLLPGELAVCRLPPDADVPATAAVGVIYSVTRTPDETSIICDRSAVPEGAEWAGGWRAFVAQGPLEFSLVGVLNSMLTPLVQARVPVFAISTYTTDYVLVREQDVRQARTALRVGGHTVV